LLQANAYYKEWNIKFGQQGGRQEDIMQQERRRWSIVSKSPRGMYLLDADLKAEMVSFPILIFPRLFLVLRLTRHLSFTFL